MSITNGYATLAEFKAWSTIASTDATDDTVIEQCIEAASRYIDDQTGRTFYARSETKYFDIPADGGRTLKLNDDLLTITTLTNGDANTIAATEYNLWPYNNPPYARIILTASSAYYWQMDSDGNTQQVLTIAGTWGYSATAPHDIRQACLMMADNLYHKRAGENTSSVARVTAMGVVLTPQGIPDLVKVAFRKYLKML